MDFEFGRRVEFEVLRAEEILRAVPALPGVFALWGEAGGEPYLTRAADLRRRMTRLLAPPEEQSKRLNLRARVRTIEYTVTGSEFESLLVVYDAASRIFGAAEARRRLRLHTPYFLRLTMEHAHPRVYTTNRLSRGRTGRGLDRTYGPFASRAAAERYCDAVLDLFKLRRCYEELEVHPEHPGCAYGEMKRCLAPCNQTCSAVEYAAEARAVEAFFETRGESMLAGIAAEREEASAAMEFERAAAAHERYQKVKAAAGLADELVRPVLQLRAVIVQEAAKVWGAIDRQGREGWGTEGAEATVAKVAEPTHRQGRDEWGTEGAEATVAGPTHRQERDEWGTKAAEAQEAAVFLLEGGVLVGPERLSTLGVRAVKEQTSVGSSLFAQPLMLQAVPLQGGVGLAESPEVRAEGVLGRLRERVPVGADLATVSDHLSLLRRWYYRPEKQRKGEVFFPAGSREGGDGSWPVRRILRGAARMALGEPKGMAETDREGAAAAKVKILHEGREGVERVVPVVGRRGRGKQG